LEVGVNFACGSSCVLREGRTVRVVVVDSSRPLCSSRVLHDFLSRVIRFVRLLVLVWKWFVGRSARESRMVRGEANGPRVVNGWSAPVSFLVKVLLTGVNFGWSAPCSRSVHDTQADNPRYQGG
jgi:hypothetical protein